MKDIDYKGIVEFAKLSYEYEPGTKKAVDEGIMSMNELTIYHYINHWTNQNIPKYNSMEELDRLHGKTLAKAFYVAKDVFKISPLEAKTIFFKVCKIPRA